MKKIITTILWIIGGVVLIPLLIFSLPVYLFFRFYSPEYYEPELIDDRLGKRG